MGLVDAHLFNRRYRKRIWFPVHLPRDNEVEQCGCNGKYHQRPAKQYDMRFHHIGIACKNIGEEIASISRLHTVLKTSDVIFDKEQNAQVALLTLTDGTNIEL